MTRRGLLLLLIWSVVAATIRAADSAPNGSTAAQSPFGIAVRTPWSTSRFRGRPEPPPPYQVERAFSQLSFEKPTTLSSAPGTRRLFVAEYAGKIFSIPPEKDTSRADLFLDVEQLVERLNATGKEPLGLEAVYGMTFDPGFAENRYVYVCYVVRPRDRGRQLADGTRVVRLTASRSDPPQCDIESEQLIISWLQGGHNGGCLKFGPDGYLYISSGDGGFAFPPDGRKSGQDMTTLLSKVLRIDVHQREHDRAYAIPVDNPFVALEGARGETWAYGMRNPWRMSFDRQTGALWVGDVGWELWELVYRVAKGGNYGWSIVEGRQPVHPEWRRGPTPIIPATIEIDHTEGASVTGGFVYRGEKFPELQGTYVFGDWETRRIWGLNVDGDALGPRTELVEPTVRIVDFAEDQDGELYLLDNADGTISTLARNTALSTEKLFPRKLSETGIFASVPQERVAPGVLPFSIQAELWSDFAIGQRYLGVPGDERIRLHDRARPVPGSQFTRIMDFPRDTVVVKTLSLDMTQGNPASRRRIETQILHYDGKDWRGYTYQWDDAQTDAALVPAGGKNQTFEVTDASAPGGRRVQNWRFASRIECLRCHNPWSEHTLAFNIPQINRPHDYGSVSDNQVRTLRHIGILEDVVEPFDPLDPYKPIEPPKSPESLPRLANPHDGADDLNARARAYLHVNCSHCHRFNGGGSSYVYLQYNLPLAGLKAVDARPTQGTFGIHDARVIAPGDPYRSALFFRLSKSGPGHMPYIGAKIIDPQGLKLVHDWIRQLPMHLEDQNRLDELIALDEATVVARERREAQRAAWQIARRVAMKQKRELPNDDELVAARKQVEQEAAEAAQKRAARRGQLVEELLANPTRAMLTAAAMRAGRVPETVRDALIAASRKSLDAGIRDLYEAFLPDDQRAQRLGDAIVADDILKLPGDAQRGQQLFHESTVVQCRNCHRIGQTGTELGPELNQIGKKYDRAKLLENMLQPSLNIEPRWMAWMVETKSGNVYTGLLVKKDEREVVLKDIQNKQHRIPVAEVEGTYPQHKSLMPEQMFRDFTAQQVADLLTYLASLK